jgi:hypothetical protein
MLQVEPNGTVAAEPSIVIGTPDGSADEPLTIVTAGDGYLLVFARVDSLATPPGNPALFGLRLAADLSGRDAEPFPIATASAARAHVSATYDGEAWLVVWQERAGESSWDIRAARVPRETQEPHRPASRSPPRR